MMKTERRISFAEFLIEMLSPLIWSEDKGGLAVDPDKVSNRDTYLRLYLLFAGTLVSSVLLLASLGATSYAVTQVYVATTGVLAPAFLYAAYKVKTL